MTDRHALAVQAVADACRVANAVQADLARVAEVLKSDRSPVTVADFAVQAVVNMALADGDAATPIVGEEQADMLREAEHRAVLSAVLGAVHIVRPNATTDDVLEAIDRGDHDASGPAYWTLDPVDGTKGFLRGQQYAIALGYIEGGAPTIGVMGCPNLPASHDADLTKPDDDGVIYAAADGNGSHEYVTSDPSQPKRRIKTGTGRSSTGDSIDDIVGGGGGGGGGSIGAITPGNEAPPSSTRGGLPIRVCESVEKAHTSQSDSARIIQHLGGVATPVRIDSQCKYAVVARGQADAYLRLPTKPGYVERIWDHAAGSLVAQEAGVVVTDIHGKPLDFGRGTGLAGNSGVICAAPHVHGRIIQAIADLGIKAPA